MSRALAGYPDVSAETRERRIAKLEAERRAGHIAAERVPEAPAVPGALAQLRLRRAGQGFPIEAECRIEVAARVGDFAHQGQGLGTLAERGVGQSAFVLPLIISEGPRSHRIEDVDRPRRTPAKTLALLGAAHTAGASIGVVGTLSTTEYLPYQVARVIASLDHLSGGRAAWNVVT